MADYSTAIRKPTTYTEYAHASAASLMSRTDGTDVFTKVDFLYPGAVASIGSVPIVGVAIRSARAAAGRPSRSNHL